MLKGLLKKQLRKDEADYKEMVYEGYGPNGIAIVVETATDNPTRTVANIKKLSYPSRWFVGNQRMFTVPFRS